VESLGDVSATVGGVEGDAAQGDELVDFESSPGGAGDLIEDGVNAQLDSVTLLWDLFSAWPQAGAPVHSAASTVKSDCIGVYFWARVPVTDNSPPKLHADLH
jgi:hypothetical protein